ncbi:Uncharacterised protein [Vibrio cholerae]|nr:Uncharacterised protein [Vibrio cholerae]
MEAYPVLSMLWLGICGFLVSAPPNWVYPFQDP